ncbi:P-loop NTPase family protein [Mycolicibacterium gadium]|uniref:Uncharacterized protein n=1 Tax=Mycolicibacterium gadium TaxID=1794 RepID=A0A7I7WWI1_MYCGU|nr:ATP-binding protein [Mycolicibacterium gadium]BBZ20863.1 hypothetical protein MGAD_51980 [Mycolicibacterium gadium]
MDLGAVSRWYPIGSVVQVVHGGGRIATGRLEAIDSGSLVLMMEGRPTMLSAQVIDSIEMAQAGSVQVPASAKPVLVQALEPVRSPQHATPRGSAARPNLSPRWNHLADVYAVSDEDLRLSNPTFEADSSAAPEGRLIEIQTRLNKVKNGIAAGRRLNNPETVRLAIRELVRAAHDLHYPPGYNLAALLLLDLGAGPSAKRQAEEWAALAAPSGARYAWDHAVMLYQGGRNREAVAVLGQVLASEPADDPADLLLCLFVLLVLRESMTEAAVAALSPAVSANAERRSVAIGAGLYLVFKLTPELAYPLEPILLEKRNSPKDLKLVLDSLLPGAAQRIAAPPECGSADPIPPAPAPQAVKDPRLQIDAARRQLDFGRFEAALAMARAALAEHSGNQELLEIIDNAEREQSLSRKPAPPPRILHASYSTRTPDTPYAQAQYADTKEKNWAKAEKLYHQAIAAGDNAERAVRSLAWGLHRKKRSDEALKLLQEPPVEVHDRLPHQNMIITVLSDLGQFYEAAELLEELLLGPYPNQTKTGLLKRLIVLYRKQRDADRAKDAAARLLSSAPKNPEFRRIAEDVSKAARTGIWDKIDVLAAKVAYRPDQTGSIGLVLQSRLERCEYAGVNPHRVQEGGLSESDVRDLEALIHDLGPQKSLDRAKYNLTAARVLWDLGRTEDNRFRQSLRAYCAAMGDLLSAERRPGELIRTYYAEAVSLGPWNDMAELKVKQFIVSYLPPEQQQPGRRQTIEHCLDAVLEHENLRRPLLTGLLTVINMADNKVGAELISRTWKVQALRDTFFNELWDYLGRNTATGQSDYAQLWADGVKTLHYELEAQRQELQLPSRRPDPLLTVREDQQLLEDADRLAPTTPLDTDRIKKTIATLDEVHGYLEQTAYLERERLESKIRTGIAELVETIVEFPTRLSLEYLVPLLRKLDAALAGHFAQVQSEAEPSQLEVTPVLSGYAPNAASTIQVQLSVTNLPRRSPVGDVVIHVLDNAADYHAFPDTIPVAHSLRDEQTETCTVALTVTPRAIEQEVITFRYQVLFTVRSERRVASEPETLSLRLNRNEDWKPIRNPYLEGPPVNDKDMFYGRDTLVEVLVNSLEHVDTKCVVLYGQKRVGKSSVLIHLERRLRLPLIPARLSLQETVQDLRMLSWAIADAFWRKFEDLELDDAMPPLGIPRPELGQFADQPQISFNNYMRDMKRAMRRNEAYRCCRMVLLLDEFTVLYTAIERGKLGPDFMKVWKAMLESNLFSSVVAGNDLMPRFLKRFPNEFQVASQEQVSYLDEEWATKLIWKPIPLDNGESRYRGDAVRRILELTARNPYYIQLFCNRLVQHMNDERQPLIGPADVDRVTAALVSGDRALPLEQFDNLLTPGDADVSEVSGEDALDLLKASLSGHRGDLYLDNRKALARPNGPQIIEDLLRRDVIVQGTGDRYRIKVGLFAEWLHQRKSWEIA